jgi:hypothetical protein
MSVTFDTVRKLALALDHVEERPSYGTAGFRVNGALFLRQHQDGESLVVRMGFDEREAMMAEAPETYYITDHYLKYEWVLVRMARIQAEELRDLLRAAWKFAVQTKRKATPRKNKSK